MKSVIISFLGFLFLLPPLTQDANAQWAIGASYEIRDEDPENGFGIRLEKGFLRGLPLLDLGLRAHFSYFNETNGISRDNVDISGDFDMYDFGLAAVAGINLGLVRPYAGLGIGRERYKLSAAEQAALSYKENSFYWNGFGGAEFSLLPLLKPFIEYRITRLTDTDDIHFDNINRLSIGINVRF
jgi:opacity protein-like surface antigen